MYDYIMHSRQLPGHTPTENILMYSGRSPDLRIIAPVHPSRFIKNQWIIICGQKLTAYSCGGSAGIV